MSFLPICLILSAQGIHFEGILPSKCPSLPGAGAIFIPGGGQLRSAMSVYPGFCGAQAPVNVTEETSMNSIRLKEGGELHFLSAGEEHRGEGPVLLFVHGAGANGAMWHEVAEQLGRRYWSLALDLPGHGRSTGPGSPTIGGYSAQVEELIEQLAPGRAVVVGNSMGGGIALQLALDCPQKLRGIGLVGTGARLRVLPEIFETIRADFPAAVKKIAGFALSGHRSDEMVRQMEQELGRSDPQVIYDDFLACDRFDAMGRISQIQLPTLVVCGRQDQLTPLKYSEFLVSQLPRATLRVIEACGHAPMIEQPAQLSQALEEFLAGI